MATTTAEHGDFEAVQNKPVSSLQDRTILSKAAGFSAWIFNTIYLGVVHYDGSASGFWPALIWVEWRYNG